jgi:RNA polymerase sigma-70 factor (ECF subfamily)
MLLDRAISQLSPGYRAVLVLVDGQGFDYQAAGEILGVAEGTVASRLHRARQAMYRALNTEGSCR